MDVDASLAWLRRCEMLGARYIWAASLSLIMLAPSLAIAQTRQETIDFIFSNSGFKRDTSSEFQVQEESPGSCVVIVENN